MNERENIKSLSQLAMLMEDGENTQAEFFEILRFLTPTRDAGAVLCPMRKEAVCLRRDIPKEGLCKEVLLATAPEVTEGYISVPKALEDAQK